MTERAGQGQQPTVVSTEVVKCNGPWGDSRLKGADALVTVWSNGKTECSIQKNYSTSCSTCPRRG